MTRTRRHHHQLRNCADFSPSTCSSSSSSEQNESETLFRFSPSLATVATLLEDIGNPQHLLSEPIAVPELEQVAVALSKAIQLDAATNKTAKGTTTDASVLSPIVKHGCGHEAIQQASAAQGVKRAPTIGLASGEADAL